MVCPDCGRYAPADRETGYNADDVCPGCQRIAEEVAAANADAEAIEARLDRDADGLSADLTRLAHSVDLHVARLAHIRAVLSAFYRAVLSSSSVQPVLDLAEQLDPSLRRRARAVWNDPIITPDQTPF